MHLTERSSYAMQDLLTTAMKMFTETLDYPIADVQVLATTKPFLLTMSFRCAAMWETGNAFQIKQKIQQFSLDLFKSFGYLILIEDPATLDA